MLLAQFDYKRTRNVSRSYNDVHAPMNGKAENSWLSDLSGLSGFICSRGACSEFLLWNLCVRDWKKKKRKETNKQKQPRHRKNCWRFQRISFGSASKGFERETENLVHGKIRCNLRVTDLCPMVHFFCCFSSKREKVKQLVVGLVEGELTRTWNTLTSRVLHACSCASLYAKYL